jgi:hypothetical protein
MATQVIPDVDKRDGMPVGQIEIIENQAALI